MILFINIGWSHFPVDRIYLTFDIDDSLTSAMVVGCSFQLTAELISRLAADTSVLSLSPVTLPEAAATLAYLDLLIRDLKRRGFDMHVLPLFQLQRLIAKLALCSEVRAMERSMWPRVTRGWGRKDITWVLQRGHRGVGQKGSTQAGREFNQGRMKDKMRQRNETRKELVATSLAHYACPMRVSCAHAHPCNLMQGMYQVATLTLCETMDELGLSSGASVLEASLGPYWDISPEEAQEAKHQAQMQVRTEGLGGAGALADASEGGLKG